MNPIIPPKPEWLLQKNIVYVVYVVYEHFENFEHYDNQNHKIVFLGVYDNYNQANARANEYNLSNSYNFSNSYNGKKAHVAESSYHPQSQSSFNIPQPPFDTQFNPP